MKADSAFASFLCTCVRAQLPYLCISSTAPAPKTIVMRLFALVFLTSLFCYNQLEAQAGLDGTWEGTMTIGGIYSHEALPMQLYLTTTNGVVKGRSYVQLPDGSTLRMDLEGKVYKDGSIRLLETAFAGDEFNERLPKFSRKYQILFNDDIWNPVLKGFWQEIQEEIFDPNRRRGRMTLKRRKAAGA